MDWFTLALFALALACAATVAVLSGRRPVLAKMAFRNAFRRPKQTATVVAGLMIGTAIISSALVAGDSAKGAIRGYVYQSLGSVDESVAIDGYPYFPQSVYDALRADPDVRGAFDAMSAHAIWQGAGESPRTGLFEPNVALIGFEPDADAGFGTYEGPAGGTSGKDLQPGEGIATQHLAEAMGLQVGDTVTVSYVKPVDPILPRIQFTNGTLDGVDPGVLLPGVPLPPVTPTPSTHDIAVDKGAQAITVAVARQADPAGTQLPIELRLVLREPGGATHEARAATSPLFLNLTAEAGTVLAEGTWNLTVSANVALRTSYFGVAVVSYPVYDLALLQERAEALRRDFGQFQDRLPGLGQPARLVTNFTVAAITDGGRGDLFDFRDALFVRLDEAQGLFGRAGEINLVKFSNPGDERQGEGGTAAAMQVLNRSLERIKAGAPDLAAVQSLEAKPLKRDFLAVADDKGQTLTSLLVFAGSLSIITGLLLILNIFTMLAEERRAELGMARAVGLSRADLVRLSVFEGSLYAVAAAALGAVLGLGLAYAMIVVMNTVISRLGADLSFPAIEFAPSWAAILVAFSAGALLTFATILGASRRASRLNVVRAIRRIEEPEHIGELGPHLAVGIPLALVGLAVSLLGWIRNPLVAAVLPDYRLSLQVAAPVVLAVGIGVALRPITRRHVTVPVLAGLLAAYYTLTYFLVTKYDNIREANIVGPIRGVLLTLCVVIVVVHLGGGTRLVGRLLARAKPMRPVALPAVSYPLHKKFRTGMTVAMFSVVLLSIGFFSIFGALFQVDPTRHTGGFDVEGRTTLGVDDLDAFDAHLVPDGTIAARIELPEFRTEDRKFITVGDEQTGTFRDYRHVIYGYDEAFVAQQQFHLSDRLGEFATDEAAYRAVLDRDDLVIVSYLYSTNPQGQSLAHGAGEKLQIHLGNATQEFTIAGIQEQYHYPGIFLPKERVTALFPTTAKVYLFKLQPGVDPVETAKLLERNYRAVGMDAKPSLQEVLDEQSSFRQVLGAMKLFLGLGLVVGVLSLGIITSRSVLERRQEIGMLRAIGYTGKMVRRIFFTEVTYTILLGAVVGIACAILVTYGLWFAVIRQLNYPYIVPWGEIGTVVLASYLVALLATVVPIGRSAKVAPAEALRYVE